MSVKLIEKLSQRKSEYVESMLGEQVLWQDGKKAVIQRYYCFDEGRILSSLEEWQELHEQGELYPVQIRIYFRSHNNHVGVSFEKELARFDFTEFCAPSMESLAKTTADKAIEYYKQWDVCDCGRKMRWIGEWGAWDCPGVY